MSQVAAAIQSAERLLPGRPAAQSKRDPRWRAIISVAEFVETNPTELWEFTAKWGSHRSKDLQAAIATCLLEHLLEHHSEEILPKAQRLAKHDANFASTFRMCWKFDQAAAPRKAKSLRKATKLKRHAI